MQSLGDIPDTFKAMLFYRTLRRTIKDLKINLSETTDENSLRQRVLTNEQKLRIYVLREILDTEEEYAKLLQLTQDYNFVLKIPFHRFSSTFQSSFRIRPRSGVPNLFMFSYHLATTDCQHVPLFSKQLI